MILEVFGKHKFGDDFIDSLIVYASEYLNIPDDIHIILSFKNLGGIAGTCAGQYLDEGVMEIQVNRGLDSVEFTRTIFHEMVHCKQMIEGDLVQGTPNKWKGVTFHARSYFEYPWEIQAYEYETLMEKEWYATNR